MPLRPITHGAGDPPDERRLAASRIRFLTTDAPEPATVRPPILASWRRSQDFHVAADRVEMSYVRDIEFDTPLTRSAAPVLRALTEQLAGQSVSVVLTDPNGLVLTRLTGDRDLERHLDRVLLAPGFSYAEDVVGTNGIGTALEMGGPAHVFGHEHYAENLEELACAGVPLQHPITGRVVGAIDLTCWRKDSGPLLLTLARATAEQIHQSLLTNAGAEQHGLLQEYQRTCSRRAGVVLALTRDVAMVNDHARTMLEPADQATLLAHATEVLNSGRRGTLTIELPSGQWARLYCRPVLCGSDHAVGIVAHATLELRAEAPTTTATSAAESTPPLAGLVGSSLPWLHACHQVERSYQTGEWLAVQGEPGVGKLAVLRAVQLRRQPVGRFVVLEATAAAGDPDWLPSARRAILEDADSVVVRHIDLLDGHHLRGLSATLQEARNQVRARPLWAAVTSGTLGPNARPELLRLLQLFPSTVEVPPLRLHLEDLAQLVPLFLARSGHGSPPVCSPEALRMLMRMSWPGNTEQVHQVLDEVVTRRRGGVIGPEDLPLEAHTVSRRVLSPLESMERDAIVRCLGDAGGNKMQAARSLGMSRATIYRKIREYGIIAPSRSTSVSD